jgi:hypothetical protein
LTVTVAKGRQIRNRRSASPTIYIIIHEYKTLQFAHYRAYVGINIKVNRGDVGTYISKQVFVVGNAMIMTFRFPICYQHVTKWTDKHLREAWVANEGAHAPGIALFARTINHAMSQPGGPIRQRHTASSGGIE